MRAVFCVDLPAHENGSFPKAAELLQLLRRFGWETAEIRTLDANAGADVEALKMQRYRDMAAPLFLQMPEVAAAEKDDVVFCGYVADDQTRFVVTRPVDNQVTFRLLHPVLPRLQGSARKMAKRVLASSFLSKPLTIADNRIVVYEREHDHIIITGRVVSRPLRETVRTNLKDVLLTVVPLLLLMPVAAFLVQSDGAAVITGAGADGLRSTAGGLTTGRYPFHGTMERLSTALITTALVSFLGLATTYFDIRRNRTIAWDVARENASEGGR